jgi:hypothetical protein
MLIQNCCCDFICTLTNDSASSIGVVQLDFANLGGSYPITNVEINGNPISLPFTINANDSVDLGFRICADISATIDDVTLEIKDSDSVVYNWTFPMDAMPLGNLIPGFIDCGSINVGNSTTGTLTIPETIACCTEFSFSGLTTPFSIQASEIICNGNGSVDIPITFEPTTTGSFSQNLTVSVNSCASVNVQVVGEGLEGSGLFVSYVDPNNEGNIFCDNTIFGTCPDPISRLYCGDVQIYCPSNNFCGTLAVNNGLSLCDCGDSWNCNLCGNDSPFWIPFRQNDKFMFQFQQPVTDPATNGWFNGTPGAVASFNIKPCCEIKDPPVIDWTEYFDDIVTRSFVGTFEFTTIDQNTIETQIQQIEFDLYQIYLILIANGYDGCFAFEFNFATSGTFPEPDVVQTYCSEPFKIDSCSSDLSSVFESYFSKFDCFGYYYGENFISSTDPTFPFRNRIRIPGSFEQTNFQVSKNVIESTRRAVSSQLCETWTFNSFALPPRMAKIFANILTGANVAVDSLPFTFTGEIPKNNEISTRWFVSANFENCDCNHQLTSCE